MVGKYVGYLFDSSGGKALVELGGHKLDLQEEDEEVGFTPESAVTLGLERSPDRGNRLSVSALRLVPFKLFMT